MKPVDDAKKKLGREAARAAVESVLEGAKNRVEAMAEEVLEAGENALAEAEEQREDAEWELPPPLDGDELDLPEIASGQTEPDADQPTDEERAAAARIELDRLKAEWATAGAEPASAERAEGEVAPMAAESDAVSMEPSGGERVNELDDLVQEVEPLPSVEEVLARAAHARGVEPGPSVSEIQDQGPLDGALRALERGAAARGTISTPTRLPVTDLPDVGRQEPVSSPPTADEVLARAAEVRAGLGQSPEQMKRRARAEEELERLRDEHEARSPEGTEESPASESEESDSEREPWRKRRL